MLVSDVINSASIAYTATESASNQIPYLGLNWFPAKKKAGLDLKWIKGHKGLPVSLKPSNFDALPALRARNDLKIEKTQMAFFRESMIVTEEEAQEIARVKDANDPYLETALNALYDDTNTLVAGAEVVPERMRMSLLATVNGHPTINIASDGVTYAYDYDPNGTYASSHYVKNTGNSAWTDTTNSTPITDLINAKKALRALGQNPEYAIMNSTTFGYLMDNAQVRNTILLTNPNASMGNIVLSDADIISVIKNRTGLTIVVYDKMYEDGGVSYPFYPNNKVTLLPSSALGGTWFGTTPEERSAGQVDNVDVTIYGTGIAIATKTDFGPPVITSVTASEIVLPSYEGMDATYVIEVA